MVIGIDIDGVLCEYNDSTNHYGSKLSNDLNIFPLKNPSEYELIDKFECDDEFFKKYINTYEELRLNQPAIIFASEVIKKLKDDGHTIYIVTARTNFDEWFPDKLKPIVEEFTINWLKENDIYYDKIFFNRKKAIICKENNIDILIEDSPSNIRKVKDVTTPFIYDAGYNNIEEFKDYTRVYTWYDIYYKINNYKK